MMILQVPLLHQQEKIHLIPHLMEEDHLEGVILGGAFGVGGFNENF